MEPVSSIRPRKQVWVRFRQTILTQNVFFGKDLTSLRETFAPNDENQQELLKDPLHVPVGPITRARSKKIKEALNGLILQRGITSLAQKKMKAS